MDISDDDFLSLMTSDGDTKDDVRMPEGEIGAKIKKLFLEEEKETRRFSRSAETRNKTQQLTRDF